MPRENYRMCRLKSRGGKLVEGKVLIEDGRVASLNIWGEFFADPLLEERIGALIGLDAKEACKRLEEVLSGVFVAPRSDVLECLRRLLCEG